MFFYWTIWHSHTVSVTGYNSRFLKPLFGLLLMCMFTFRLRTVPLKVPKHNSENLQVVTYIPPSTTRERTRASRPVCSRFTAPFLNTTLRPLQPTLLNNTMDGRENSWTRRPERIIYHLQKTKSESSIPTRFEWASKRTTLTCPTVCMEQTAVSEDRKPMASVLGYSPFSSKYMFSVNWAPSYATQLTHRDTHIIGVILLFSFAHNSLSLIKSWLIRFNSIALPPIWCSWVYSVCS